MPLQYHMRAFKTIAPRGYIDWIVDDTPDTTGIYSGVSTSSLSNIIVNKITVSKTENFFKATSTDGYFLHLNSYDLLHPTPPGPPINVPSQITGIAVVRGSVDGITPRDYASMFWSESQQKWIFAFNTNGDNTTIGNSLSLQIMNGQVDGYLAVGIIPAQIGLIRIPNSQNIVSRNAANDGDLTLLGVDSTNHITHGAGILNNGHIFNTTTATIYDFQVNSVSKIQLGDQFISYGTIPATTGFLRAPGNSIMMAARNTNNSINISICSTDADSTVQFSDSNALTSINGLNLSILAATGDFGSGSRVIFIREAVTVPTTNPTGGGILYVTPLGALQYRGPNGMVTTIAAA